MPAAGGWPLARVGNRYFLSEPICAGHGAVAPLWWNFIPFVGGDLFVRQSKRSAGFDPLRPIKGA